MDFLSHARIRNIEVLQDFIADTKHISQQTGDNQIMLFNFFKRAKEYTINTYKKNPDALYCEIKFDYLEKISTLLKKEKTSSEKLEKLNDAICELSSRLSQLLEIDANIETLEIENVQLVRINKKIEEKIEEINNKDEELDTHFLEFMTEISILNITNEKLKSDLTTATADTLVDLNIEIKNNDIEVTKIQLKSGKKAIEKKQLEKNKKRFNSQITTNKNNIDTHKVEIKRLNTLADELDKQYDEKIDIITELTLMTSLEQYFNSIFTFSDSDIKISIESIKSDINTLTGKKRYCNSAEIYSAITAKYSNIEPKLSILLQAILLPEDKKAHISTIISHLDAIDGVLNNG